MSKQEYNPAAYDLRIEARDFGATDHTGIPVLQNLNIDIGPGEYISFEGESGAGKTLFATALCGIRFDRIEENDPEDMLNYSGTIRHLLTNKFFADRDVELPENYNIRKNFIGFVPQDHNMIGGLTAEENIRTPQKINRNPVNEKIFKTITAELGISDILHKKANNLSGGEKQRVSIARGFAAGPKMVVLDEPTAALHEQMKHETNSMLGEIVKKLGITVIVVSHDLSLAWRRVKMADGSIISDSKDDAPLGRHAR